MNFKNICILVMQHGRHVFIFHACYILLSFSKRQSIDSIESDENPLVWAWFMLNCVNNYYLFCYIVFSQITYFQYATDVIHTECTWRTDHFWWLHNYTLQLVYSLQILKLSDTLLKDHYFDMLHSINNHDYYTYTSRLQDIITNVQLEYDIDLS